MNSPEDKPPIDKRAEVKQRLDKITEEGVARLRNTRLVRNIQLVLEMLLLAIVLWFSYGTGWIGYVIFFGILSLLYWIMHSHSRLSSWTREFETECEIKKLFDREFLPLDEDQSIAISLVFESDELAMYRINKDLGHVVSLFQSAARRSRSRNESAESQGKTG